MSGQPSALRVGLLARSAAWMHLSRTAVVLIGLAALTNLLGYVRDIVLAAWYGASPQTDAFFVGSFVPLLIYQIVVLGSLVPAFLPVLVQTGAPGPAGEPVRHHLVWMATLSAAGVGLALTLGLALAAPAIVALLAPGLAPDTSAQAVAVLRLSLPLVCFVTPAGVLSAALNAQNRFVAPALGAAATNVGIVAALLLAGPTAGIAAAALGMSGGSAAGLLVVALAMRAQRNAGYATPKAGGGSADPLPPRTTEHATQSRQHATHRSPSFRTPQPDPVAAGLRRTAVLALPLLATVGLVQAVAVAERYLGSRLPAGSLSLLAYAMKLNLLPIVILAGTLTTLLFPSLSRAAQDAASADGQPRSRDLAKGIAQVLTWTVPAAAWLIVGAGPVMRLLYERGQFSASDSTRAAGVLAIYAVGLVPHALMQMLPRAYHARQDMLRPLALHGGGFLVYLVLAVPASAWAGVNGLAAAFSGYAYATLALFVWGLRAELAPVAAELGRILARVVVSAGALAAACALVLRLLPFSTRSGVVAEGVAVGLLAGVGLLVYAACMTLLSGAWRLGRHAAVLPDPRPTEALEQE